MAVAILMETKTVLVDQVVDLRDLMAVTVMELLVPMVEKELKVLEVQADLDMVVDHQGLHLQVEMVVLKVLVVMVAAVEQDIMVEVVVLEPTLHPKEAEAEEVEVVI